MNSDYKRYIERKAEICMSADSFSPDLYEKYDVKKGLRDSKGNGVVVGLTTVSEVNGTNKVDGVKVPCEGRLKYRGYDIRDLAKGFLNKRFGFEECTYLLLFGSLPDAEQLEEFKYYLAEQRRLPNTFVRDVVMVAAGKDIMNSITRCILTLASYDKKALNNSLDNVISQCISAIFCIAFLCRGHLPIRLRFMPLEGRRVARICMLGTSGFTMGATNSIVQLVCNKCAAIWGGDLYVGVMTILNSIREIFSTPMNGFSSGATPVMSYNYGRGDGRRVMKASQLLLVMMLVYSGLIWALIYIFPDPFINLFTTDGTLMAACHHALQIYFFGFIFMSFHMSGQQTFVALGYAKQAVFFSLFRKVIIVVPLTIILPYFIGVDGVVLAEPISNVVGGMATYTVMRLTVFRKLRRQLAKASLRP